MAVERRKRVDVYVGPREYVSPSDLEKIEATGQWLFEEKLDGFWCLAVIEEGIIRQLVSRTGLVFGATETSGLVGLRVAPTGSGRLAGELTADEVNGERSGTRRLHVFDVLDWAGLDFRDLPQTERRAALSMIYDRLECRDRVLLVEQRMAGAAAWFHEIVAKGGEGIVAKRKDARYRSETADGKTAAWIRCKPVRSVDYVIVGHGLADGGTPNLRLGLYQGGTLVEVGKVTMPGIFAGRALDSLVGAVVEVVGWEVWPSGIIRSGHVARLRPDKPACDCTHESAMRVRGRDQ